MKKRALSGLLKLDGPLLSILSLLIAIVISGVIMAVCGYNPIEAFGAILAGSFGSQRAIVQTLTQATPLIFTGLAFAFAKKASLINLGAEGQLYMGALASAAVGMLDLGLPMALHLPLAVAAGMAAGGLYAGLVGVLKVKFGSNEVIATVMLNSIATYLVDYLLNGPMLAENSSVAQTERVLETAQLPRIFQQYQLTIAILLAVAACILVKLFMDRTALGYEIRAVGLNPDAAETAGISKAKVTIVALCISGCIAGLAGASHVLGVDRRLINGFSNDYGFSGISVAALAAARLCPACKDYMLGSHASEEPASRLVLSELGLRPFLYAGMRLGEGTGAVAVMPLLDMGLAVYREMATFEDTNIEAYQPLG